MVDNKKTPATGVPITGAKVNVFVFIFRIVYIVVQLIVGDKRNGEEINEFLPPFIKLDAHTGDILNSLRLR